MVRPKCSLQLKHFQINFKWSFYSHLFYIIHFLVFSVSDTRKAFLVITIEPVGQSFLSPVVFILDYGAGKSIKSPSMRFAE